MSRLGQFLRGYDFFVSYCWEDGRTYALALANELRSRGYRVFLDSSDFAKSDNWKREGERAVRRSQRMILVGSPCAVLSKPVYREVRLFLDLERRIFPITFGDSLEPKLGVELHDVLPAEILRLYEPSGALDEGPTEEVVDEIDRSFRLIRHHTRQLAAARGAAGLLALLLIGVLFASFEIARERDRTQEQLARGLFAPFDDSRVLTTAELAALRELGLADPAVVSRFWSTALASESSALRATIHLPAIVAALTGLQRESVLRKVSKVVGQGLMAHIEVASDPASLAALIEGLDAIDLQDEWRGRALARANSMLAGDLGVPRFSTLGRAAAFLLRSDTQGREQFVQRLVESLDPGLEELDIRALLAPVRIAAPKLSANEAAQLARRIAACVLSLASRDLTYLGDGIEAVRLVLRSCTPAVASEVVALLSAVPAGPHDQEQARLLVEHGSEAARWEALEAALQRVIASNEPWMALANGAAFSELLDGLASQERATCSRRISSEIARVLGSESPAATWALVQLCAIVRSHEPETLSELGELIGQHVLSNDLTPASLALLGQVRPPLEDGSTDLPLAKAMALWYEDAEQIKTGFERTGIDLLVDGIEVLASHAGRPAVSEQLTIARAKLESEWTERRSLSDVLESVGPPVPQSELTDVRAEDAAVRAEGPHWRAFRRIALGTYALASAASAAQQRGLQSQLNRYLAEISRFKGADAATGVRSLAEASRGMSLSETYIVGITSELDRRLQAAKSHIDSRAVVSALVPIWSHLSVDDQRRFLASPPLSSAFHQSGGDRIIIDALLEGHLQEPIAANLASEGPRLATLLKERNLDRARASGGGLRRRRTPREPLSRRCHSR